MMNSNKNLWLPPFGAFTEFTPVVPEMYWNIYSQEQRWKTMCEQMHKLVCYADSINVNLSITHDDVEQLKADFEKFKESGFIDYYEEQIEAWINENMQSIIEQAIKMVYFGLSDDGYFQAYIPDSWNEIEFDTGAVYGQEDYGCLILKLEVTTD